MQPPASARPVPLVVALALLAAPAWLPARVAREGASAVDDRVERVVALPAGQSLGIAVTVGTMRVTGEAGRADARVEIARHAPSAAALARVPVNLAETPEGPRLSIVQADGGADAAIRTDVVVTVPAEAHLEYLTIAEGRLTLRGLRGAVRATVARGGIEADEVSGVLRLETTIGSIAVTRARLAPQGLLRLRTFNGDVRLGLAGALADTRVMALALNGAIDSAVPLTMKAGWGPRWGEATIGQPDRVVSIDVVTGTIRIEAPAERR